MIFNTGGGGGGDLCSKDWLLSAVHNCSPIYQYFKDLYSDELWLSLNYPYTALCGHVIHNTWCC